MRDFHLPGRSPVLATEGMCATSHPLAASEAISILKRGGNAMDAAIGGAVLLGLCEPHMTGIGGDCFVLFSSPNNDEVQAYNGSGRAPAAASAEKLRAEGHETVPPFGIDAVTLPGAVDAFCHLSETHGRIGLDAVLAPAIHYADHGVPVAPRVAFDWPAAGKNLQGHGINHYMPGGKPLGTGQVFKAPAQAEVLRRIAKNGRDAFYTGEVAEDMLTTLQAAGGVHTADDFANVTGMIATPVSGTYGGLELFEHPPNGQGATAILILNILKHFDLAGLDPLGSERAHIETEASKLAYDLRNRLIADPDHTTRLEAMLSTDTASALAARIDPRRAITDVTEITESVHRDTVYITVVDRDRMAVSLIYSIFHGFGSGIASEKFGILFQNRGAGFNLIPGHPNEYGGGKRSMHTIIPAMLRRNGNISMPFGVMGGQYQSCGHARFVTNMCDFGMDAQGAIDAPRCFADAGELRVERGYDEKTRAELADLGHKVVVPDGPIGGAQAIEIHENGVLEGASDARKDGCALGY
ncbi:MULTISPECIES: gamma-glutamyltransferase family protein [unclassified Roseovarius]|uniref:gamma-glutamyltransferase family protein n=1 Tax=unclassified Roseovarius TaxID=2614913 RepID=UPI00273EA31B|nr:MULTISPECIES: gamma-glutamyltransferase family protein [unclassified Roseovarius]